MFPIRDENPTLTTSGATFLLIGLNVAAWAFVQGFGSEPALSSSVCRLGTIPGELLGNVQPGTLVPLGSGVSCNWLGALRRCSERPAASPSRHVGGFVAGIALIPVFRDRRQVEAHRAHVARLRG